MACVLRVDGGRVVVPGLPSVRGVPDEDLVLPAGKLRGPYDVDARVVGRDGRVGEEPREREAALAGERSIAAVNRPGRTRELVRVEQLHRRDVDRVTERDPTVGRAQEPDVRRPASARRV